MSALKKLAGDTAIYGLSSIIGRFLNYLFVPFYTGVFLPEQFGIVTEIYSYAALLYVVFTFGMETTYFRFCNKPDANKEEVFLSIQSLLTIGTLLLCGSCILLSGLISTMLKHPGQKDLFIYLFAITGVDTFLAIPFARLRQENRAKKFALIKLFNITLTILLNVFLLLALPKIYPGVEPSIEMVFLANLIANSFQLFFFTEYITKWKALSLPKNIQSYITYGLPLMVMGLAGIVNEVVDRVLLKFLLPDNFYHGHSQLATVGIYGACYKLSIFMSLGIQAFRYASEPFFFAKSKNKSSPELYAKVMHWFILCCSTVFLCISLNLNWIQLLLRQSAFREGLSVVAPLLLANLFLGVYYNLSIWYKLTDKTHYGMWISIGGALLTLVLNFLLIPQMGYMGCAWATLICYASMAAGSYLLGNKFYPVPYNISYTLFLIVTSATLVWYWQEKRDILHQPEYIFNNLSWMALVVFQFVVGRQTKYY